MPQCSPAITTGTVLPSTHITQQEHPNRPRRTTIENGGPNTISRECQFQIHGSSKGTQSNQYVRERGKVERRRQHEPSDEKWQRIVRSFWLVGKDKEPYRK